MGTTLLALSLSGKHPVVRLKLDAWASGASISALIFEKFDANTMDVSARFASEYFNGVTYLAWASACQI